MCAPLPRQQMSIPRRRCSSKCSRRSRSTRPGSELVSKQLTASPWRRWDPTTRLAGRALAPPPAIGAERVCQARPHLGRARLGRRCRQAPCSQLPMSRHGRRFVNSEDLFIGVTTEGASIHNNPRYDTHWCQRIVLTTATQPFAAGTFCWAQPAPWAALAAKTWRTAAPCTTAMSLVAVSVVIVVRSALQASCSTWTAARLSFR